MKYIAVINFGKYRTGDTVPIDLPYNSERLARGLIKEVKIIEPKIKKATANGNRKPKNAE